MMPKKNKQAFTLVEFSVVLLIIALLASTVLVANNLLKSSLLQAIIAESKDYKDAINLFNQQYGAYPGDMANASSYWPTTHNGNGDNQWQWSPETFYAWQQLSLTNLIPGAYTGTTITSIVGINLPGSQLVTATYFLNTNGLEIGGIDHTGQNEVALLTSARSYLIDVKIDDGMANSGNVLGNITSTLLSGAGLADHCTNGSGTYLLQTSGQICRLHWIIIK